MALSTKTRLLNVFRSVFKLQPLERWIARKTKGRPPEDFWCKLLPNPYQYPAPSWRTMTRDGIRMQVDINDFMGYVYYFGIRSESYDRLFSLCDEGDCVVDIGANIGWTLLNLARRSRTGRVIAFEPDPFNFGQCRRNVELNGMSNVTLLPVGLGEVPGQAEMDVSAVANRGGHRVAPDQQTGGGRAVEIRRLDDVDEVRRLPAIDLIKIDVEGYEAKVLKGAAGILRQHKPTLFVEIDDRNLRDQGDSPSSLVAYLRDAGYASIVHAETRQEISPSDDFSKCHFDLIAQ